MLSIRTISVELARATYAPQSNTHMRCKDNDRFGCIRCECIVVMWPCNAIASQSTESYMRMRSGSERKKMEISLKIDANRILFTASDFFSASVATCVAKHEFPESNIKMYMHFEVIFKFQLTLCSQRRNLNSLEYSYCMHPIAVENEGDPFLDKENYINFFHVELTEREIYQFRA